MKKVIKILTILVIVGLLFITGVVVNDSSNEVRSYKELVFNGIKEVNADGPCTPPPPGYPNNCE